MLCKFQHKFSIQFFASCPAFSTSLRARMFSTKRDENSVGHSNLFFWPTWGARERRVLLTIHSTMAAGRRRRRRSGNENVFRCFFSFIKSHFAANTKNIHAKFFSIFFPFITIIWKTQQQQRFFIKFAHLIFFSCVSTLLLLSSVYYDIAWKPEGESWRKCAALVRCRWQSSTGAQLDKGRKSIEILESHSSRHG